MEERYFLGHCDPVFWVIDNEIYNNLRWWQKFLGPGKSVIFGSYNRKDCVYVCAHLNEGRPLSDIEKELEQIHKQNNLVY